MLQLIDGDEIQGVWHDDILSMGQRKFTDGTYYGHFDELMRPSGKGVFEYSKTEGEIY